MPSNMPGPEQTAGQPTEPEAEKQPEHVPIPSSEDEQRKLLDEAERRGAERTLGLITNTTADSVGNQLTIVHGFAELLATNPSLPESLRKLANFVLKGTQAATDQLTLIRAMTLSDLVHTITNRGPEIIDLTRVAERLAQQPPDRSDISRMPTPPK